MLGTVVIHMPPMNSGSAMTESFWFSSDQIAEREGTTERWARQKYASRAKSFNGSAHLYMRLIPAIGGYKREFNLQLLDEPTQQGILARLPAAGESGSVENPAGPPPVSCAAGAPDSPGVSAAPLARLPHGARSIVASEARNQLLPLEFPEEGEPSAIPTEKLCWARARRRVIATLIPNNRGEAQWENRRGQELYGQRIHPKESFIQALAKDSESAQPLLAQWDEINQALREESRNPRAAISPLSATTIWRFYRWYTKGRPLLHCGNCGGDVDQHSGRCERCDTRQCLPPGLEALQDLDRSDKNRIRLRPDFADYFTAAYVGGDESVGRRKRALERPRSAAGCLELIRNEIAFGNLSGPAPSYYQVKRWVREFMPRVICDYGRHGEKRALARRGPYIVRSQKHLQVNDSRLWDFRRVNIRTWLTADGRLYRPFLCAGLDAASRDVVFCFDLYPSALLFKSTLRKALLKWGIAREEWMDNGKEFTCEEVMGGRLLKTWNARFEIDDECASVFDKFGSEAHFCLKENPTGKALLERFFQTFDRFERTLGGWTGERAGNRPERLKVEEREHEEFCKGSRPETPLLHFDVLTDLLGEYIEYCYRHRKHRGDGMLGRTPAQVQAAFQGERKILRPEELDILLWHRLSLRARGDKVSFVYRGHSLIFRSEELLALPGDCDVEVHVDPINVDRALALSGSRVIVLEPVNPTGGQTSFELKEEIHRQRKLEKTIREATFEASRLAPIPSPARSLAMMKPYAVGKEMSLAALRRDRPVDVSIPAYAEAANALRVAAIHSSVLEPEDEEPVFTSRVEAEEWQKRKQKTRM
jgi:hypothetical protein